MSIKLKQFTVSESNIKSHLNNYKCSTIRFNLAYINNKFKNEIKFCTDFSTCRAYITDAIRTIILNKRCKDDAHTFKLKNNIGIKLNQFLLSIKYKIKEEHLLHCLRIINYYNEINKFPKFKLIGNYIHKTETIFFIKIPIIYKKNPHLFSLFTLLLRILCDYNLKDLEKIKNITDLENHFYINKKSIINIISSEDKVYIYEDNNYTKFKPIFENYKKLFYKLGKKTLNPESIGYDFHNQGGIFSLCNSITSNDILNKRIEKLFLKVGDKI